jgi:hypothetical protein
MTTYNQTILKEDAKGNVIQDSYFEDMTFRGEYTGTNLIYKGYARPGAAEGSLVWQIAKLAYDGSSNILSVKWPQNTYGAASSEFIFSWTDRATYTFS